MKVLLVLCALAFSAGTAFGFEFGTFYPPLEANVASQNYDAALESLRKAEDDFEDNHETLWELELGMLLHLAGRYEESNKYLQKAEERVEDAFTASVTTEIGSFLTNDLNRPFEGEDFEKVMINLIGALNYAMMGNLQEALVEARKVDHRLGLLAARLEGEELRNVYREDAFARYLSALLYEAMGEANDAYVAYQKSFEAYQNYQKNYATRTPVGVAQGLLRLAAKFGLAADLAKWKKTFPGVTAPKDDLQAGQVVFLAYNGLVPVKKAQIIEFPVPVGQIPYIMKLAFPKFQKRDNPISQARIRLVPAAGAGLEANAEEVEDIGAIAVRDLDDRISRIKGRVVAQAMTKFAAVKLAEHQARENYGDLGGLVVGIAGNVWAFQSTKIDDRSWRFLPGQIQLGRMQVPAGKYQAEAEFLNAAGHSLGKRSLGEVEIHAGRTLFLQSRQSPTWGFDVNSQFATQQERTGGQSFGETQPRPRQRRPRGPATNLVEIGFVMPGEVVDSNGNQIQTQSSGGFMFGWLDWREEDSHHFGLGYIGFSHDLPTSDYWNTDSLSQSYLSLLYRFSFAEQYYAGFDLGLGSSQRVCDYCGYSAEPQVLPLVVVGVGEGQWGAVFKLGPYQGSTQGDASLGESDLSWSGFLAAAGVTIRW